MTVGLWRSCQSVTNIQSIFCTEKQLPTLVDGVTRCPLPACKLVGPSVRVDILDRLAPRSLSSTDGALSSHVGNLIEIRVLESLVLSLERPSEQTNWNIWSFISNTTSYYFDWHLYKVETKKTLLRKTYLKKH